MQELGRLTLIHDQQQGFTDAGQFRLWALEELDRALAADVVLEQVAAPLSARSQVALDPPLRGFAAVEAVQRGEQGDGYAWVGRGCGDDEVGAEVAFGVGGFDRGEDFAQVHPAAGGVDFGDVVGEAVAGTVED